MTEQNPQLNVEVGRRKILAAMGVGSGALAASSLAAFGKAQAVLPHFAWS